MSSPFLQVLAIHVWREWRTHRRMLVALALILPITIAVITVTTGGPSTGVSAQQPLVTIWAPMMCCSIALLSVGSDFFASERKRGGDLTLVRIPDGLHLAYFARLLFFCALAIGSVIYGDLVAALLCWSKPALLDAQWSEVNSMLVPLFVLTSWWFAGSTWVWSSALSLPAGFLFIAFAALPTMLGPSFGASDTESALAEWLVALPFISAPLIGWYSFAFGRRSGRTPERAVRVGIILAALLCLPSWVCAERQSATDSTGAAVSYELGGSER